MPTIANDCTGLATRTIYAKAGDQVEVLKVQLEMALVHKPGKDPFWVRAENLTENINNSLAGGR